MTAEQKVSTYLEYIEGYVLKPVGESPVGEHCIASLLLMFAAVDGLGRLTAVEREGVEERFTRFISKLGTEYAAKAKVLYELRNSLVHNAINAGAFIAQTQEGRNLHLQSTHAAGGLYLNTREFHKDLTAAVAAVRQRFLTNSEAVEVAGRQLIEYAVKPPTDTLKYPTTPPPEAQFAKHFIKADES